MLGAVSKEILPDLLKVKKENLVVVSIMPCTAKKFEASRDEMNDVDFVLTTQELGQMINQAGIEFEKLFPESFDLPLGFKTGAGVIFGNSGGVAEAVLRYLNDKLNGNYSDKLDFTEVRGNNSIRETTVNLNGNEVKIAVVFGLKNAKDLLTNIKNEKAKYDFIEIMACPGGCVGGAGQPISFDEDIRNNRAKGLYETDKMLQLHKSNENPYVQNLYKNLLGKEGSEISHTLLHTNYKNRKRIVEDGISLLFGNENEKINISVCVGTGCYIKGSQTILNKLIKHIDQNQLNDLVNVKATFCTENCDSGPSVIIGNEVIHNCDLEKAITVVNRSLKEFKQKN